jgi:hypothetical protein
LSTLLDLYQWLDVLPGQIEPTSDDFYQVADDQRERIQSRTAQGIGVENDIFAPYAERTHKAPPVNLRKTGDMMDSIAVMSDQNSGRIFFASSEAEDKARYNNEGTDKLPQRFFFGVSENDRNTIVQSVRQRLVGRLSQMNAR